jgi:hypothetical protein
MISFEEFKAEYKELVTLQMAIAGAQPGSKFQLHVTFDVSEEGHEIKHKKALGPENNFTADFPTSFNIYDSNIGFNITIINEKNEEVASLLRITILDLLTEQNLTTSRELKVKGLFLYVRFLVPENTYPMYTITIHAKDLPLLTGMFSDCDPFLRILKKNPNFGTYTMVYESEVHRNTKDPQFRGAKISLQRLCGGS